jgi:curved DNA-binding protein CbpA
MSTDFDAYRILQIAPHAEDIVVEAAFRVLARRYHPDGHTPDPVRMLDINRAYDLLRSPVRRRRYDREHGLTAVGPGAIRIEFPPTGGLAMRTSAASGAESAYAVVDFGRYQGWNLKDLARHDPDYLRWLARSSGGVRYRNQIQELLPGAGDPVAAKF